jgi:hypothetical protein
MSMENDFQLLRLAANVKQVASLVSRESELGRVVGRLARHPYDLDALAQVTVDQAREEGVLAPYLKSGHGLLLLQFALERVSALYGEELWNDKHPDHFGQAWDGVDDDLMSVWREKVCTTIEECRQEWLLVLETPDEYRETLVEAGASEQTAEQLVEWLSAVRCV